MNRTQEAALTINLIQALHPIFEMMGIADTMENQREVVSLLDRLREKEHKNTLCTQADT